MCQALDDALPVIGAVVGSIIPGVGTAIGAGLGAAVGGVAGNYVQTHNWGDALGAGALAGGTTLLGGAVGGALAGGAGSTVGDATNSLGDFSSTGLTSGTDFAGQASTYGTTGVNAANFGSGVGLAGGTGAGAATGATGGLGGVGASGDLNAASGGATTGSGAPMGFGSTGDIGVTGASGAVSPSAGADVTAGGSLGNGAVFNAGPQGVPGQNLSSLYGPNSTAAGSPMGQGIDQAAGGVNMEGSQLGSTFQQPSAAAAMSGYGSEGTPATWGTNMTGLGDLYGQVSPYIQGAKTVMSGVQQYKNAQAQKDYVNQIQNLYSPNSPYASQMAQTMARADAATGRNSQYANRATQLAAALTESQSRALTSNPYYSATSSIPNYQTNVLNGLFNQFGQAATNPGVRQGINQLGSAAFNGLSSLFGS